MPSYSFSSRRINVGDGGGGGVDGGMTDEKEKQHQRGEEKGSGNNPNSRRPLMARLLRRCHQGSRKGGYYNCDTMMEDTEDLSSSSSSYTDDNKSSDVLGHNNNNDDSVSSSSNPLQETSSQSSFVSTNNIGAASSFGSYRKDDKEVISKQQRIIEIVTQELDLSCPRCSATTASRGTHTASADRHDQIEASLRELALLCLDDDDRHVLGLTMLQVGGHVAVAKVLQGSPSSCSCRCSSPSFLATAQVCLECIRVWDNLLFENPQAQVMIGEIGGIELVVQAMKWYPESVKLQEAACFCLFSAIVGPHNSYIGSNNNNPLVENARRLHQAGGIEVVILALKSHRNSETLQQDGCTLLEQLLTISNTSTTTTTQVGGGSDDNADSSSIIVAIIHAGGASAVARIMENKNYNLYTRDLARRVLSGLVGAVTFA